MKSQTITLTASQIKELADLAGFVVDDTCVDDYLPDDSAVTIHQFDEPQAINDEDGEIAGYWRTVMTYDECSENGTNPLGKSTPPNVKEPT